MRRSGERWVLASIQKRGKRWYLRYWEAGREHKKSLGKNVRTEAQAKRWLAQWETAREPQTALAAA